MADEKRFLAFQEEVEEKYTKPGSGIPKTDLTNAVQTSLDKADSAVEFISQTITDAQKNQARTNINAASGSTTINGTELGYNAKTITLTGANIATSATDSKKIDVALGEKALKTTKINTKPLNSDITLNAVDIPYTTTLISTITTVKGALDAALAGISKIFYVDEDRDIDYKLSIEDGYFYINLVS